MRSATILPALLLTLTVACSEKEPQPTPTKDVTAPQAEADARDRVSTEHAGTPAPALALETGPDGRTTTVADLVKEAGGRPVLVNLWATWCAPCIRELPSLEKLAGAHGDRVAVVAVSQDMEGWRKVTPFLKEHPLKNVRVLLESKMAFGAEAKLAGLPTTILYGADGKEKWRYAGDRDWASDASVGLVTGA